MNPIRILRYIRDTEEEFFSVYMHWFKTETKFWFWVMKDCSLRFGPFELIQFTDDEHMIRTLSPLIDQVRVGSGDHAEIVWDRQDHLFVIIQRAWRKYRLRTSRKKNDLVIRGLTEFFWHPSLIDFKTEEIKAPVCRLKRIVL